MSAVAAANLEHPPPRRSGVRRTDAAGWWRRSTSRTRARHMMSRAQRFVSSCAHRLRASRCESHAVGVSTSTLAIGALRIAWPRRVLSRAVKSSRCTRGAFSRIISHELAWRCVVGDRCIGGGNLPHATSLATRDVKCVARHAAARVATNHCYSKASDAACFFVPATMSPARCWRKHRRNLGKNRSCRTSQRFNALGNAVSCGQCWATALSNALTKLSL
jgi:hypothetical protein